MNSQELKNAYAELYGYMAASKNPDNMKAFGNVMTEMFDWMTDNKPEKAQEWLEELEGIRWKNYLTPTEAQMIVDDMDPKAPWSREQWRSAMQQAGFPLEEKPCYNSCALWVVMNMIMSDSSGTIAEYVGSANSFKFVHAEAMNRLKDKDGRFNVRDYFLK